MKFTYRARTKEGKLERGTIEASSLEAATLLLQKYRVFVTSLEAEVANKPLLSRKVVIHRKVSRKDLAVFFRQLAIMLESRVSVVQSLSSLAVQSPRQDFRESIFEISKLVEEGVPLSDALAKYPKIFNSFYVSLIRSGEASGNISVSLYYISDHLERESDIVAQLRQAMVYPIFVIAVLCVVVGIIIVGVMPKIADLIREASTQPPLFTRIMLSFYEFLENFWWVIGIGMLISVVGAVYYFTTKKGRRHFDVLLLKTPFIKTVLKKVFIARFSGNIATLMTAGISINRALSITEETVDNHVYKAIINDIGSHVSEGEKISSSLEKYPEYFPPFVVQMIKVGEETGKLDKTLLEIVGFYQKEVKRAIDLLSSLLEPILIIFLGLVVGVLAISVLAPLYGTLGSI